MTRVPSPPSLRGAVLLLCVSCSSSVDEPLPIGPPVNVVVHLGRTFDPATVEGTPEVASSEPAVLRFDGPLPEPDDQDAEQESADGEGPEGQEFDEESPEDEPLEPAPDTRATYGFEALLDVEQLAVVDGKLTGRTGEIAVLAVELDDFDDAEPLHSVQIRMRVSADGEVGLLPLREPELDREEARDRVRRGNFWIFSSDVERSDELRLVTIELGHMRPVSLEQAHWLLLQPLGSAGATFEIEELRFVTRAEHLAGIDSGFGRHALGEISREALALRAPETASVSLEVPPNAWIDLSVGTIGPHPATFTLTAVDLHSGRRSRLLRRTVTTPERWEPIQVDLDAFAGEDVELRFAVESPEPGTIGFFGTPVVRTRGARPEAVDAPQGVIYILADTLRRDHLDAYGYERETAPTLARLAREGALFLDPISQGTWTKVAVPALLSSTYPASNGIVTARDRLPDSITTQAEAFREAGYATFATSSVMFTGRLSNLDQGLDVLHERASVGKLEHSRSKTARVFVDRLADWIERREGGPFYARLHVFDPHDPFLPYAPYDSVWSAPDAQDVHEEAVERLTAWQKEHDEEETELPPETQLVAAEIPTEEFVAREIDWYDESIRAMDTEIARLLERLEEAGLIDDVLIALVSDHGEEFLEHGQHFHGNFTYGEMTNVPLILWGPKWIQPGTVVEETVQTIDLMPTLLELAELPIPEQVQGQSLVPLLRDEEGWVDRPAIAERRDADFERNPDPELTESHAIVHGGYRLVHHFTRSDEWPEYELFDHVADPLNLVDVADQHPEVVADLKAKLELWRRWAEANQIEGGDGADLTDEERAQLEALGYGG